MQLSDTVKVKISFQTKIFSEVATLIIVLRKDQLLPKYLFTALLSLVKCIELGHAFNNILVQLKVVK